MNLSSILGSFEAMCNQEFLVNSNLPNIYSAHIKTRETLQNRFDIKSVMCSCCYEFSKLESIFLAHAKFYILVEML